MGILIPFVLIFFACLLIWRACDGFEVASEYVGRNLSEGVRGGTINAISSSIPELFTTLIALFVLTDEDGFAMGIGTTAGSALFNGMIIPALCILTVVGSVVLGREVTSVNVSTKVVLRDGLTLIACQIVLILLINGDKLYWWQGLVLMGLYVVYLVYMLSSMKASEASEEGEDDQDDSEDDEPGGMFAAAFYWLSGGPLMELEGMFVGEKQKQQMRDETWNGWPLLLTSTAVIGAACWALVKACEWLGTGAANGAHPSYELFGCELTGLGMPAMFVAVIFASMATSVPDTVMSIRDARDGDYDDAVANALGSNIFDICFALGFPLFLYTILYGPIQMSDEVSLQSGELRLLLLVLTIIGFFVYFVGQRGVDGRGIRFVEMRRNKAFLLLVLYAVFVVYIIGRSQQNSVADGIAEALQNFLTYLPSLG